MTTATLLSDCIICESPTLSLLISVKIPERMVVADHMDLLDGRHLTLDGIEKGDKFVLPVALPKFTLRRALTVTMSVETADQEPRCARAS
jgi:hypothetical protein